jgi:hypothetical protein
MVHTHPQIDEDGIRPLDIPGKIRKKIMGPARVKIYPVPELPKPFPGDLLYIPIRIDAGYL